MRIYFPLLPGVRASVNVGGHRRHSAPAKPVYRTRTPSKAEQTDVAKRRMYNMAMKMQIAVDQALAASTSELQRQSITGWWVEFGRAYELLLSKDSSVQKAALPRFNAAITGLEKWVAWKPAKCDHCGAPDQTAGQPCRYCRQPT